MAKAWGVVACDVNNDGWMDLFVANDTEPNFLFVNRKGKFEEEGLFAGVAYSAAGRTRSGMGVDAADYDEDGWVDLFVSNVDQEMFSLYHNNKNETFGDLAIATGIGPATKLMSGWGGSSSTMTMTATWICCSATATLTTKLTDERKALDISSPCCSTATRQTG